MVLICISQWLTMSSMSHVLNFLNAIYNNIKNRKYLGINMTKNMQDLYTESYETLLRETKEINGEIYHVLGFEDSILLRNQFLPN